MPTVTLRDGTQVHLPIPEGSKLIQLGIRVMYLNQRIDEAKDEEIDRMIDDIVYLLLDFWKSRGVEQPFDRLTQLVQAQTLSYENELFRDKLENRVKETASYVAQFKFNTDDALKQEARKELKKRGFIGSRDIEEYDKSFVRKAGIHL